MRKYGKWAGNHKGIRENKTKCIAGVHFMWGIFYQCSRKRGYGKDGLFCKQHAKMIEQGRHLNIPKDEKE